MAGPRTPVLQRRRRKDTTSERSIPSDIRHRREVDCTREARRRNSDARTARPLAHARAPHSAHPPVPPAPPVPPRPPSAPPAPVVPPPPRRAARARRCTSAPHRQVAASDVAPELLHADAESDDREKRNLGGGSGHDDVILSVRRLARPRRGRTEAGGDPDVATGIARIAHRIIAALNRARRRHRARRRVRAGSTAAAGLAQPTARGHVGLAHAGLTCRGRRARQGNARPVVCAVPPVVATARRVARATHWASSVPNRCRSDVRMPIHARPPQQFVA